METNLKDYATTTDLATVWRDLTSEEETRADALIHYASNFLRQIAINNGKNLDLMIAEDTTGVLAENVKMVVLNAVQRELASPVDMVPDATQWSQSASPYSESMSFSAGTSGNLYFKTKELNLLGFGSISGRKQMSILRGIRQNGMDEN